jgi:hypothetical protein
MLLLPVRSMTAICSALPSSSVPTMRSRRTLDGAADCGWRAMVVILLFLGSISGVYF